MSDYCVYLLECANGTLYTGIATDLHKRYQAHCLGKGAQYTRSFPPKRLVAAWTINGGRAEAQSVEHQIKQLSRSNKWQLVEAFQQHKIPVAFLDAMLTPLSLTPKGSA